MHLKRITRSSFNSRSLLLFASLAAGSAMAAGQFSVGPGPAPGATASAKPSDTFRKLDADGNGSISRQEAGAAAGSLPRNFDALDTDKDGMLSPEEFDRPAK
jgi:hypothetical protein